MQSLGRPHHPPLAFTNSSLSADQNKKNKKSCFLCATWHPGRFFFFTKARAQKHRKNLSASRQISLAEKPRISGHNKSVSLQQAVKNLRSLFPLSHSWDGTLVKLPPARDVGFVSTRVMSAWSLLRRDADEVSPAHLSSLTETPLYWDYCSCRIYFEMTGSGVCEFYLSTRSFGVKFSSSASENVQNDCIWFQNWLFFLKHNNQIWQIIVLYWY